MLTYEEVSTWWTAPAEWQSFSRATHSTREIHTSAAGTTSAGTSSTFAEQGGVSTSSTTSSVSTGSRTSTVTAGGVTTGATYRTWDDTSSSTSVAGGATGSGESTANTTLTGTTSSTDGLGFSEPVTTTTTDTVVLSWPSTYTTTLETTSGTSTGTTTTRTCATSWTTTATGTGKDITYSGAEFSTTETDTTTTGTTTTAVHSFLPRADTVIFADAAGGPLWNDVIVWAGTGETSNTTTSSIDLFGELFTSVTSGTSAGTLSAYDSHRLLSTVWRTHALSTATATTTESTNSTTSTGTTTATTTASTSATTVVSSLGGVPWDTTSSQSTTEVALGDISGSTTYTIPGPITVTAYTYTVESTTSTGTAFNQFAYTTLTESFFGETAWSTEWDWWDRSYTLTSSFEYPVSTSTKGTIERYSSDGWKLGTSTITSQRWEQLSTVLTVTSWDNKTNAVLIGQFTSTASAGASSFTTAQTVTQTWDRTDFAELFPIASVTQQSEHEFSRTARVWQQRKPRGFLGIGGGWEISDTVFAGLSSTLVSGDDNTAFSLVASLMPRFAVIPDASAFVTNRCWLDGHPASSSLSATWLGTQTGPRTSASLAHQWVSTSTSATGTSTVTVSETKSATYAVAMTGTITGDFIGEYAPTVNSDAFGTGRPIFFGPTGGAMGGISPITTAAESVTFPPGAVTLSWETAVGVTTSSSASTSTGELTLTLGGVTAPVAYSFEEALRVDWIDDSPQLLTASVHAIEDNPL